MDAAMVEILQLCQKLEQSGWVVSLTWYSRRPAVTGRVFIELWRNDAAFKAWLADDDTDPMTIQAPATELNLVQIIGKLSALLG